MGTNFRRSNQPFHANGRNFSPPPPVVPIKAERGCRGWNEVVITSNNSLWTSTSISINCDNNNLLIKFFNGCNIDITWSNKIVIKLEPKKKLILKVFYLNRFWKYFKMKIFFLVFFFYVRNYFITNLKCKIFMRECKQIGKKRVSWLHQQSYLINASNIASRVKGGIC